jgi:hypothetical protein
LGAGTLPNARLATGAAVANLGYTPVNKAGDTISGSATKLLILQSTGGYARLQLEGTTGNGGDLIFASNGVTKFGIYNANGGADLGFYPNDGSSPSVVMTGAGNLNVGGGTYSGNQIFQIANSAGETGLSIACQSTNGKQYELIAGGTGGAFAGGAFGIYDRTGGAARLTISNAGYVQRPSNPAFMAAFASQSYHASGTIVFDAPLRNDGGYSTSTGRFTAPIAGWYHFDIAFQHWAGTTSTGIADLVTSNWGTIARWEDPDAASKWTAGGLAATVYLGQGDYAYLTVSGDFMWSDNTFFSGFMV